LLRLPDDENDNENRKSENEEEIWNAGPFFDSTICDRHVYRVERVFQGSGYSGSHFVKHQE
jgi:hypothetical protein